MVNDNIQFVAGHGTCNFSVEGNSLRLEKSKMGLGRSRSMWVSVGVMGLVMLCV